MATLKIYYGASKPIVAIGKHQCKLLAFAEKYRGWHTYKQDRITKRAVLALEKKGALEVLNDQFRFKYPDNLLTILNP